MVTSEGTSYLKTRMYPNFLGEGLAKSFKWVEEMGVSVGGEMGCQCREEISKIMRSMISKKNEKKLGFMVDVEVEAQKHEIANEKK